MIRPQPKWRRDGARWRLQTSNSVSRPGNSSRTRAPARPTVACEAFCRRNVVKCVGFFRTPRKSGRRGSGLLKSLKRCVQVSFFSSVPASFKATQGNIENLSRFFQKIGPQPFRLAWEPRGPWPCQVVRDLCAEHKLIHCVDPLTDRSQYGDAVYWRLHGKGSYSYHYTEEDLAQLQRLLYKAQAEDPAYILFNNVSMKSDAKRFMGLLGCRR
jgi:hypothetical protein